MSVKTCSVPAKEQQQLYMLELLVDRLNLTPEKIREIGSDPISVTVEFLDFPIFHISENEFWSAKEQKSKQSDLSSNRKKNNGSLDFTAGKSCLFPKRPNELVEAMRVKPLLVNVHKIVPKIACGPQKRESTICKSTIPLSGCLCDQIAMAANDSSHQPEPYDLRNTWNLVDERETPSGTILLHLRLTCLGKSVVRRFAMREKSFLFKNSDSTNEFQCGRIFPDGEEAKKKEEERNSATRVAEGDEDVESVDLPQPRSVIGLASICQELTKRDGGPLKIVPSLKLSTVCDKMATKNLAKDATVDKEGSSCVRQLDSSFRERFTDEFPCGKDICAGGLCAGPRKINFPEKNPDEATNFIPVVRNCCSERENNPDWGDNYFYKPRMRGGGRWDEDHLREDQNSCAKYLKTARIPEQSLNTLINGTCESSRDDANSKPGCGCYGKSGTGSMITKSSMKNQFSGNQKCHGVDCLIRAFKETQDFVDSIGKVPGLAGLGLMDPTESPFFGRERDVEFPTSCVGKNELPTIFTGNQAFHDRHATSKIHQLSKKPSEGKLIDTILPAPGTGHASSGHHRDPNAFHADTISLTSSKSRKKYDENRDKRKDATDSSINRAGSVIETGPCGTHRCKSRKKKSSQQIKNDVSSENLQLIGKKLHSTNKSSNFGKKRLRGKSKSYGNLGPAGYRLSNNGDSCVRVSRRIMRLVNAMRDPRFSHGHRNCLDVRLRVPGNMGWLWNTGEIPGRLKPSIGWKPGAISKYVWDRLQEAKASAVGSPTTIDNKSVASNKSKRGKIVRSVKSFHSTSRSPWARNKMNDDDGDVELPPTLHIHRKDGTYYVTMYPIKAENINDPELQEKTEPLQFKITKEKNVEQDGCSSSSASDMEIEFSPPAAINRYRKKEAGYDRDTQVNQQEILDTFEKSKDKEQSGKKPKKGKNKK